MAAGSPVRYVSRDAWRGGMLPAGERAVPEETAVAFTYNGSAHAVMMATPIDLEDFALGFSLAEGMISGAGEVETIDVLEFEEGIELRLWIDERRMTLIRDRRRHMAGPTGCGLCGVESLAEAMRPVASLTSEARFDSLDIARALAAVEAGQVLHRQTRAVHAAGLWHRERGVIALREDVGRHNALDKLTGAVVGMGESAENSILVLSSRVSVEMVQKAAILGAAVIVAVSAPTALAIRTAEKAGITVAAVARRDGFEVFTHPRRIAFEAGAPAVI